MALHDRYARVTPYELAFPDLAEARTWFEAFAAEALERGSDADGDPASFVMLASVGRALREVRGSGDEPALVRQHGLLLWHAFRTWRAGEEVALLRLHAARYLFDAGADDPWDGGVPAPAGYVQLPQHLVWLRGEEEAPPESLDGFFWATTAPRSLHLLLALGLRGDRPGLTVVPLVDLPLADAPSWASASMREDGPDFASTLPGSEIEGLYELREAGEAVKMAARTLRHMGLTSVRRQVPPSGKEAGGPPASALEYRILDLE